MNKLDSELVRASLVSAGFEFVNRIEEADLILFVTCSVRDHAETRALSHIGNLRAFCRKRPDVIVGVMGCMAQRMGAELTERFPHVRIVCGTRAFPLIAGIVAEATRTGGPVIRLDEEFPENGPDREPSQRPSRHSAYVCAMRGCDNWCAYCVVPSLRGPQVSRQPREVIREIEALVADGAVEITLLGQNIDSYGRDLPGDYSLADLLEDVNAIPGLLRLRFITSHPKDLGPRIPQAIARLDKVCEHLHMPPQSGSDRILKLMNRGYTREYYLELVGRLRDAVPDIALAGDFIVGFPGESNEDFEQSMSLLREVRFQQCFLFKYSTRPGTRAEKMPDQLPEDVIVERHQRLLKEQERIALENHKAMIGREVEVLAEGPTRKKPEMLTGRTRRNEIVIFQGEAGLEGKLVSVRIEETTPVAIYGKLTNTSPV